jgi:hypothetical protein
MTPGCTRAMRFLGFTSRMRLRCFEKSMMTAALQPWPARLVPVPRPRMGASSSRHAFTVSTTSSTVRGITTPIGTCR